MTMWPVTKKSCYKGSSWFCYLLDMFGHRDDLDMAFYRGLNPFLAFFFPLGVFFTLFFPQDFSFSLRKGFLEGLRMASRSIGPFGGLSKMFFL